MNTIPALIYIPNRYFDAETMFHVPKNANFSGWPNWWIGNNLCSIYGSRPCLQNTCLQNPCLQNPCLQNPWCQGAPLLMRSSHKNPWIITSVFDLADISVRSPRKLFIYYYIKYYFLDQSVPNIYFLDFGKKITDHHAVLYLGSGTAIPTVFAVLPL